MPTPWHILLLLLPLVWLVYTDSCRSKLCGGYTSQRNAQMNITKVKNGVIHGTIDTFTRDTPGVYELSGRYNRRTFPISLGWIVVWDNNFGDRHSATSWVGQAMFINSTSQNRRKSVV